MARVLVADDCAHMRNVLRLALERRGHVVTVAVNGGAAIEKAKTQVVDILVTDIFMPEEDGIGAIIDFKRNHPDIKIIAMTGEGRFPAETGTLLDYMKQLGADYAFEKPFKLDAFLEAVALLSPPPAPEAQA